MGINVSPPGVPARRRAGGWVIVLRLLALAVWVLGAIGLYDYYKAFHPSDADEVPEEVAEFWQEIRPHTDASWYVGFLEMAIGKFLQGALCWVGAAILVRL